MRFALALPLLLLPVCGHAQGMTAGVSYSSGMATQTNNPIALVFEHKQSQTLADGTHINSVSHEYFYRDNLGRTRTETEFPAFWGDSGSHMHSVSVMDPVAATMLNWQTGNPNVEAHYFSRMNLRPTHQMSTPNQNPTAQRTITPRPVASNASSRPRPTNTTESLGAQDVQGVPCDASRITSIYPVDMVGNNRPITVVTEHCMSRELGRMLRDSTEDPRTGTRSTTLQSATKGEPDPALFQPPPDYVQRPQE